LAKKTTLLQTFVTIGCVFAMFCVVNVAFADTDKTPPVEKTEPVSGMMGVPIELVLQVWLLDPEESGFSGSGVDPTSVHIVLDHVEIPITVQNIGNNRVWVYSQDTVVLPSNKWVTVEITAKDRAGNIMSPVSLIFLTAGYPDNEPPVIDQLTPPDRSTGNIPHPVIHCRVSDEHSKVDLNSVVFEVNDEEVQFTYSIDGDFIDLFHVSAQPFEYEEFISCRVQVSDTAGNIAVSEWTFQITESPPDPPEQNHPAFGATLNYQLERGRFRFIWSNSAKNTCFRIRVRPAHKMVCDVIDLDADEYWVSGSLRGYSLNVGHDLWNQYSSNDFMEWSIAIVDHIGGICLSAYSDWSSFIPAPPDAVVLRTPSNHDSFSAFSNSPVFSWDSFSGARSYLFGIAKLNETGDLFENKLTIYVESEVTSLQLDEAIWRQFGEGQFIWAVLAETATGTYSDFMNYRFTRNAPVIITDPLNRN